MLLHLCTYKNIYASARFRLLVYAGIGVFLVISLYVHRQEYEIENKIVMSILKSDFLFMLYSFFSVWKMKK